MLGAGCVADGSISRPLVRGAEPVAAEVLDVPKVGTGASSSSEVTRSITSAVVSYAGLIIELTEGELGKVRIEGLA